MTKRQTGRPERTVLYRVVFHYFDRFLRESEGRFEKEYGFFSSIIKEIVKRYLDCGNPRSGFARIRCLDCHTEHFLMFSCRSRGFCPSCHAKRLEEWGEWKRKKPCFLLFGHLEGEYNLVKSLNWIMCFPVWNKADQGLKESRMPGGGWRS